MIKILFVAIDQEGACSNISIIIN